MIKSRTLIGGALAVVAASAVQAQSRSGPAFTATGTRCEDVRWSQDALAQYPRIQTACREVVERAGKYYVRFEGQVVRVANRGQEVTINFRDGDRLTLTPPQNLSLVIDGRPRAVSDLRAGDQLTFYVPEDQLTASFFADEQPTSTPQNVPIAPETPLLAQQQTPPPRQTTLPRTASVLPLAAFGGAGLLVLGVGLSVRRRRLDA
jgi:hypothetical protein